MYIDVFTYIFSTFSLTFGNLFPVLKMDNGSGIRVMDFWNMEQVHCGTYSTSGLYRHDYIDYADLSCISAIYVFFDDIKFNLKYANPTTMKIGEWLSRNADYTWRYIPPSTDNFIIKTFYNYEFIWMNERNDTIYAGIYYTEGNGNSPQFVYSFEGVSFTGSQSPTNVSNLTFSKYLEVDFLMAGNCNTSSVNQHLHECPETRLCQCPCSPVKNGSNYTVDELHVLLLSSLKKLEKELKVDKKLLSSYVRKHVSASDERLSSRSLGIGGIVCLCLMAAAILGMDLMSIKRHTATAKGICIGRP